LGTFSNDAAERAEAPAARATQKAAEGLLIAPELLKGGTTSGRQNIPRSFNLQKARVRGGVNAEQFLRPSASGAKRRLLRVLRRL
jgi:hypothetical protein